MKNGAAQLPVSERQLKVSELLRRVLIEVMQKDLFDPVIEQSAITVSKVTISPDLKHAVVYLAPLFGTVSNPGELLQYIAALTPKLRYLMTKKAKLRYSPDLLFKIDDSFDKVAKMEELFKQ